MTRQTRIAAALCLGIAAMIALSAASCDNPTPPNSAQGSGQADTEAAFTKQKAKVPYPLGQIDDSLERRNIRERLLRYNNPSKISYIYLLSSTGGIYAYFTIKGKVSSTDSQMTTTDLVIKDPGQAGGGNVTVPAPGDDGSYGPNEPGIFFFTTDGVMVTWSGPYLLSDAPMKINPAAVTLGYVEGSKPTSVAPPIK